MKKLTPLFFLRIGLGINLLMHGLVRIPTLEDFASRTAIEFQSTALPITVAKYFLYILPFLELTTGILILSKGKLIRTGMVMGVIILCILTFGTTLKQDWNNSAIQLIYIIAFSYGLNLYEQERQSKIKANEREENN